MLRAAIGCGSDGKGKLLEDSIAPKKIVINIQAISKYDFLAEKKDQYINTFLSGFKADWQKILLKFIYHPHFTKGIYTKILKNLFSRVITIKARITNFYFGMFHQFEIMLRKSNKLGQLLSIRT